MINYLAIVIDALWDQRRTWNNEKMNPIVISNIIGPRLSENNIEFKYSKDAINKRIDLDWNREWSDAIINNKKKNFQSNISLKPIENYVFFFHFSICCFFDNFIKYHRTLSPSLFDCFIMCLCVCVSNYYHRKIVNLNSVRD